MYISKLKRDADKNLSQNNFRVRFLYGSADEQLVPNLNFSVVQVFQFDNQMLRLKRTSWNTKLLKINLTMKYS